MSREICAPSAAQCSQSAPTTCHGVRHPGVFHTRHSPRIDGLWLPLRSEGPKSNVCLLPFVKIDTKLECRTIRTAIMLTLASCYLMWMVTYMAQLHPLISKSLNSPVRPHWLRHELQHHIVQVQRAERVYNGHALSEQTDI
jgi:hypothetical protein